jgi:hypothetical protein
MEYVLSLPLQAVSVARPVPTKTRVCCSSPLEHSTDTLENITVIRASPENVSTVVKSCKNYISRNVTSPSIGERSECLKHSHANGTRIAMAPQQAAPSTRDTFTRNLVTKNVGRQPKRLRVGTPTVCTPENMAFLVELNERFKDNRHINIKILEFLPRKQISDKCVHLGSVKTRQLAPEVGARS